MRASLFEFFLSPTVHQLRDFPSAGSNFRRGDIDETW
jgi:hypothetical protein